MSLIANRFDSTKYGSMYGSSHRRVDFVLERVEDVAALVAGAATLAMMILVSINALLRYFFAAPLAFQFHVTQHYLLVCTTMLALPWGYRRGGAIQIRLLLDRIPPKLGGLLTRVGLLGSGLYLCFITKEAYAVFHEALVDREVVMGVVDWPVAWSWVWIPVGCGLLATRLLLDATAVHLRSIGNSHD